MKPITKIVPVNPEKPERNVIARAADAIASGGVVIFPTHGLYGLAADAFNPDAVRRIFRIKGRPAGKPVLVLISDAKDLHRVAHMPNQAAQHLMTCFWPGRVTFVMPARQGLVAELISGDHKIGLRQTAHPVAADLVNAVGRPLTGTSANYSGSGGCARVSDIDPGLIDAVDLVLDCGTLAGGPGSTVVDVSDRVPVILRQGAVKSEQIMRCVQRFADSNSD